MSRPVAISLSPNTAPADTKLAWKTLWQPGSWRNESYITEATTLLRQQLASRFIVLTSSGRQALYDVLRTYGIGRGDEVIIQAFTCIAVPEAIQWTGAKPVYADIDSATYNLTLETVQKVVDEHTRAIIVQHTFGIPGPIHDIIAWAKEKNIIVIEDCAHALGSTIQGQAIGTIGDAAILSFGRDKMISSIFGGAAVFSDSDHAHKAQAMANERPYPPHWWVMQQLLHPIVFAGVLPTYFSGLGKVLLVLAQQLGLVSKAVAVAERRGEQPNHIAWRYSPGLARLLVHQLATFSENVHRRQAIVKQYQDRLSQRDVIALPTSSPESSPSWLRFPVQVRNRDTILRHAKENHILLGDWYDAPLVPAAASPAAFAYSEGMCPVAEQVSRHVVNLPTYPRLTDEQVDEIIYVVRGYEK